MKTELVINCGICHHVRRRLLTEVNCQQSVKSDFWSPVSGFAQGSNNCPKYVLDDGSTLDYSRI